MENMLGKLQKRIILLPSETWGTMYDLVEKLLGKDGMWWLNALKKFLRKKNPFTVDNTNFESKEMWRKIYKKHFRMKVDFANLQIPECPGPVSDYWLIIVAKGMKPEGIFLACKKAFSVWRWTDKNLDEIVKSVRNSDTAPYATWVRARVEADKEFKNFSANKLEERGHNSITLEERILLEIMYFEQTGRHLDIQCITLCAGSLCADGSIPGVGCNGDGMRVSWYNPDSAFEDLRSREVFM